MAENATLEAARKRLAEEREMSDAAKAEAHERMTKGKPTPTQEENDLAALGAHTTEHEDDGSGPPVHPGTVSRQVDARKPSASGGYQTRAAMPQVSRTAHTRPSE